jgi:hypothetical protein
MPAHCGGRPTAPCTYKARLSGSVTVGLVGASVRRLAASAFPTRASDTAEHADTQQSSRRLQALRPGGAAHRRWST